MSQPLPFRRTISGLAPLSEAGQERMSKIGLGRDVMITVRLSRNIRAHRLWWALCSKVAELSSAEGRDWTREDVSDFFKIATGHFRRSIDAHGNEHRFPKSIAFESIDQAEFAPLLSRAIELTSERILPGLPPSELRAEIEDMVR